MTEISPRTGAAFTLKKGQFLKITDPQGLQVADFFCFAAGDLDESFSAGRSIDLNDTLRLTSGHSLYSNRSAVMAVIREDTCGRHDLLMPPCSLRMFQLVAGDEAYHPSCHENLAKAFAPFRLGPDRISTTFNVFMNVEVGPDGALSILPPRSKAGDFLVLEACMDLIVGLTACSHGESNAGAFKPIRYKISDDFGLSTRACAPARRATPRRSCAPRRAPPQGASRVPRAASRISGA